MSAVQIFNTVHVNGSSPYDVHIGSGLNELIVQRAAESGAEQVAILHQPSMDDIASELDAALVAAGLKVLHLNVPDAENGKSLEVAGQCWDELGGAAFGRRDIVIGLGGGAATDLAGFVAAAWMRGVRVIQVPTTLLAMVDAAVGGKTGINTAAGKNLVGAFHEPDAVFIDTDRLATLPDAEIIAGSAEIIKTGFIADPEILRLYETDPAACLKKEVEGSHLPELIWRSVTVKGSVVGQDLKESSLREILNYGHTFAHAVELRENFRWRHGNAVAVGMMFIANLSHKLGLIDAPLLERHRSILAAIGLPTSYEGGAFDELYNGMTRDKKNRDGNIRFVALTAVGEVTRIEGPSKQDLQSAYEAISH
ncbi:MAG: 3-dehydroquinate synthase [Corynebacterium glutamicum]|uniref:3-dehydroquinate synthase n=1 Tax=Corynebacterium glutamicum TaxID=1718 RepID=UPI00097ED1C8|nr:3-dehydroquinate synthase [Corynebacterium glutamicum]MDO5374191.1 3-dehydroquinate synthase [Corynebacterium glutamicum]SJM68376.1 3-dehydroquinate synthase [Corynebacterium glutamicum]